MSSKQHTKHNKQHPTTRKATKQPIGYQANKSYEMQSIYYYKPIGKFEIKIHSTAQWNKNNIRSIFQYSAAPDQHLEDYSSHHKTD